MNKRFPATKNVKFVLCEDVRMEANQKLALLGVFPADSITVLGPKAPAGGAGVAQLASLGFLVMLKDFAGSFDARLRIADPDGNFAFDEAMGKVELESRGNATLAWKAQGFVVPKFGVYRAELMLDDRAYPFEFEIVEGSAAKRDMSTSQ